MDDAASTQRMSSAGNRTVTVREAVIHLMRGLGCTTLFGNPGSTELPLFRDWPEDFRYVLGLQASVVLGMADGYGSVESVARDVIKAKNIVDYTEKSNPVERIAKRFGAAAAKSFFDFAASQSIRLR